jgi:hypothetical protein
MGKGKDRLTVTVEELPFFVPVDSYRGVKTNWFASPNYFHQHHPPLDSQTKKKI